ncbi:hypothetical protein AURDEDRAFT_189112, partial [Auricularia subglabra TFB-10046 SS5]
MRRASCRSRRATSGDHSPVAPRIASSANTVPVTLRQLARCAAYPGRRKQLGDPLARDAQRTRLLAHARAPTVMKTEKPRSRSLASRPRARDSPVAGHCLGGRWPRVLVFRRAGGNFCIALELPARLLRDSIHRLARRNACRMPDSLSASILSSGRPPSWPILVPGVSPRDPCTSASSQNPRLLGRPQRRAARLTVDAAALLSTATAEEANPSSALTPSRSQLLSMPL